MANMAKEDQLPEGNLIAWLEGKGAALIDYDFATDVTPEMAEAILRGNERNRHVKQNKVEEYKGALARGEWMYNGDTIRVTTTGKLIDGQHRLIAISESGIPARCLMAIIEDDVSFQTQATIDTGARRSFGDALQIEGMPYATTVAGATAVIWGYELDGVPVAGGRSVTPTIQQKYEVLSRHEGIHTSAPVGRRSTLVPASQAAALHYLFSTADSNDADEFFRLLKTGDGLSVSDPIYTLRERLTRESSRDTTQFSGRVMAAFVIIAWNYWRRGVELQRLQYRPGGARPDRFPRIDGVDEGRFRFTTAPRSRGGRARGRRRA